MECNKSVALFIDFIYLENQSEQPLSQKDILPTDYFLGQIYKLWQLSYIDQVGS